MQHLWAPVGDVTILAARDALELPASLLRLNYTPCGDTQRRTSVQGYNS